MRLSYTFKQKLLGFGVLTYIVIVCAILVLIQITMNNWIISILALIPALLFLKPIIDIDKKLKLFEQGDDGEYFVKKELYKLPATYHSHFDFQNGKKGNTDAIVVGPTGIWSIEVKSQKGEILFKDGHLLKNG